MGVSRLGLNIFELLFLYLMLTVGGVFGFGLSALVGLQGWISIACCIACAVAFPALLGAWGIADGRYERRLGRQEIMVKAREALREALTKQGLDPASVDSEVNRMLPADLIQGKDRNP